MSVARSRLIEGSLSHTVAFGAAVAVNFALFFAVARLNRTVDVSPVRAAEDPTSFSIQELPPPRAVPVPDKPEPPKPKTEPHDNTAPTSETAPTPELALDLSMSHLPGLALALAPGNAEAKPAKVAPVRADPARVYRRAEVDRAVRKLGCAPISRPPLMNRRPNLSVSVRVRGVVGPQGDVRSLKAVSTSGDAHSAFVTESLRHFQSCRFSPARKNGRAVSQWVERVYEFSSRG